MNKKKETMFEQERNKSEEFPTWQQKIGTV